MTELTPEKLFKKECKFAIGATRLADIPALNLPEITFIGRSNVGKSSLINALLNRKALARVSQTPGRTRQLNFFLLGDHMHIVDLPGYGYAKASKKDIAGWNKLIRDYLRGREQLKRAFILIDSRHGLKDSDIKTMEFLDECAAPYQLILTKTDKAKDIDQVLAKVSEKSKIHAACHPEIIATSSVKKTGLDELREEIFKLI